MGVGECRAGAQIIFPESARGLSHVTSTIFGSTVGYPSDSLASCYISARPFLQKLHVKYQNIMKFTKEIRLGTNNLATWLY